MTNPNTISPEYTHETSELGTKLSEFTIGELTKMDKLVVPLLVLRHDLFDVHGTEYSKELSIDEQLYEHPSNNIDFISHDLELRNGNALDYHQTTEKYDRGFSEKNAERDYAYRQAILSTAQELGFISKHPGIATNPIDRTIGILDSELEPIEERVAAIVINGAAGMSNVKRIRDAIRNIESGAINTNRIILTAGNRPINDAEKGRMKQPYHAGDTEFESMKIATEELLGVEFNEDATTLPVDYGENLNAKIEKTTATIGDKLITIEAIEAPFDSNRIMTDGSNAKRINTREAFLAVLPLLEGEPGAIVMESHDTWTPWQNLIGHMVFGLAQNRNVYPAGPFNAERVYWAQDNGEKVMDIVAPQDVVDEIIKTYKQLVQMQTILQEPL